MTLVHNNGEFLKSVYNIIIKLAIRWLSITGKDIRYIQRFRSRYPSFGYLLPDILNYIFMKVKSLYSFRPNAVIIEPLNKCNLTCEQCKVNSGMERQKGSMSFEFLKKTVGENSFLKRIQLTNYGEPLLHQDIVKMISYIHNSGKFVSIVTNGTLLNSEISKRLIDSGLNAITFSLDGIEDTYERVRGWKYKDVENKISNFIEIDRDAGNPIFTEINMVEFNATEGQWEKLLSIWKDKVNSIIKSPLMLSEKRTKPCSILWRSLVVLWDGTVVPCCVDMEAELKVGNVKEKNLAKIFNDTPMRQLRLKHIKGEFPLLCSTCNNFFG